MIFVCLQNIFAREFWGEPLSKASRSIKHGPRSCDCHVSLQACPRKPKSCAVCAQKNLTSRDKKNHPLEIAIPFCFVLLDHYHKIYLWLDNSMANASTAGTLAFDTSCYRGPSEPHNPPPVFPSCWRNYHQESVKTIRFFSEEQMSLS